MRRRLTRTIILRLLLGYLTATLIAWAYIISMFAAPSPSPGGWSRHSHGDSGWFINQYMMNGVLIYRASIGNETVDAVELDDRRIPAWSAIRNLPAHEAGTPDVMIADRAAGWPMRCVHFVHIMESDSATNQDLSHKFIGIVPGIGMPFKPIWPSLIADTLVFFACWSALLDGWRILRRKRRQRHGRCIQCAYSLHGLPDDQCPECGSKQASLSHQLRCDALTSATLIAGALALTSLIAFLPARIAASRDLVSHAWLEDYIAASWGSPRRDELAHEALRDPDHAQVVFDRLNSPVTTEDDAIALAELAEYLSLMDPGPVYINIADALLARTSDEWSVSNACLIFGQYPFKEVHERLTPLFESDNEMHIHEALGALWSSWDTQPDPDLKPEIVQAMKGLLNRAAFPFIQLRALYMLMTLDAFDPQVAETDLEAILRAVPEKADQEWVKELTEWINQHKNYPQPSDSDK